MLICSPTLHSILVILTYKLSYFYYIYSIEDDGVYTCQAVNEAGVAYHDITVKVLGMLYYS